jgi:hypothetical protein
VSVGDLLVLHDVGEAGGGAPWRSAFVAAGWAPERVVAPDLPGHAGCAPPVGGGYDAADAAFAAAPLLPAEPGVIVGVGTNGWVAEVFALGGKASALVLVDGLGGPWRDPYAAIAAGVEWLRSVAADPDAIAPPPPGAALDPRLRHPVPAMSSRRAAVKMASAVPVPVLLVESPRSQVAPDDADELAALFPHLIDVVRVAERDPAVVAHSVTAAFSHELASKPVDVGKSEGAVRS